MERKRCLSPLLPWYFSGKSDVPYLKQKGMHHKPVRSWFRFTLIFFSYKIKQTPCPIELAFACIFCKGYFWQWMRVKTSMDAWCFLWSIVVKQVEIFITVLFATFEDYFVTNGWMNVRWFTNKCYKTVSMLEEAICNWKWL